MADFTLSSAYTETKNFGTILDIKSVYIDLANQYSEVILEMRDSNGVWLNKTGLLRINTVSTLQTKLDGSTATISNINYSNFFAAVSTTGATGLINLINSNITNF